ncbi:MAG: hypothetical protein ACM3ML_10465 [Micromonosporaceae bacterium]
MTNAAIPKPDSSALAAVRDCGGRRSATSVYWPDRPQACSSEDAASSATYDPACKAPNAYSSAITLSVIAAQCRVGGDQVPAGQRRQRPGQQHRPGRARQRVGGDREAHHQPAVGGRRDPDRQPRHAHRAHPGADRRHRERGQQAAQHRTRDDRGGGHAKLRG